MRPRGEGTDDRDLGQSAEDTSCPGIWGTARCRATWVILRQVTRLTKISAWWAHELGELLRRRAGRAWGRGAARCSASPGVPRGQISGSVRRCAEGVLVLKDCPGYWLVSQCLCGCLCLTLKIQKSTVKLLQAGALLLETCQKQNLSPRDNVERVGCCGPVIRTGRQQTPGKPFPGPSCTSISVSS